MLLQNDKNIIFNVVIIFNCRKISNYIIIMTEETLILFRSAKFSQNQNIVLHHRYISSYIIPPYYHCTHTDNHGANVYRSRIYMRINLDILV